MIGPVRPQIAAPISLRPGLHALDLDGFTASPTIIMVSLVHSHAGTLRYHGMPNEGPVTGRRNPDGRRGHGVT